MNKLGLSLSRCNSCGISASCQRDFGDFCRARQKLLAQRVCEASRAKKPLAPLILQCGLERGMACQFLSYNQSVKALIPRQKENTPWVKHYPFSKPRSTTLCRSNPVRNT